MVYNTDDGDDGDSGVRLVTSKLGVQRCASAVATTDIWRR